MRTRDVRMGRFLLCVSAGCVLLGLLLAPELQAASMPTGEEYINSIGMKFVRIGAGTFSMGGLQKELPRKLAGSGHMRDGDPDEQPVHKVTISKSFYMGVYEVTNAQYEKYDPTHRYLRGKLGYSIENDEAVVFINWHEAKTFCDWLSEREGLPYRLPTEAEWEYACRAGTETPFHTGNELPVSFHKNVRTSWYPDPARSGGRDEVVPLHVGKTMWNPLGLYDMHGNVEEWCYDWYGPYEEESQIDPVGRADGDFKVTRGGSHSAELYYLRSANRMGVVPEERSWLIGFRVVLGEMPATKPLPRPEPELHQRRVGQQIPRDIKEGPDPKKPYFCGPCEFVKIPEGSTGPIFSRHNHVPNIVQCANGDLMTIWYTCVSESGRELAIVASRLRYGEEEWEPAAMFWDQPDRNDHTSALWCDSDGTLYHFNGFAAAATWGSLGVIMRTSTDNGRTWSKAQIILPEHNIRQMPIESIFRTRDGQILLPCDAVTGGSGGTAIHLSADNGKTWRDPGGTIAGIHACVAQLEDGRLIAFGRGDNIDGMMPMSISDDMGRFWNRSASVFPPVGGGQRPVILRLKEGPLCLVSFANKGITITDASGKEREVKGMFAAVSHDDGKTWSNIRLVSHDGPDTTVERMDGREFTMGFSRAEPGGYLSICQAANGVIHLITSRQHYGFNLKWLETRPPAQVQQAE
ncbi:MAG: SUMF1/EgtB/PvdO family nonheme iron enzyme [Planctomycetota bacterium]